jgi:hypothetical protein
MTFAEAVDRVRAEFTDLPGLELTLPQASRLWSLGVDDCRSVLDALVDAGFLVWEPPRTYRRAHRAAPARRDVAASCEAVPIRRVRR